jgi:hypothetical protein
MRHVGFTVLIYLFIKKHIFDNGLRVQMLVRRLVDGFKFFKV